MKQKNNGFTIIELIVVIVIIGTLSAISYISYGDIQQRAYDNSVLSDMDILDALETDYSLENGEAYAYYSGNGENEQLDFRPSDGNVIDVVVSGEDYCIRGYNLGSSKTSILEAFTIESNDGICTILGPSSSAL